MKQSRIEELLVRIDERTKRIPVIEKDVKRINGTLIATKVRLDDHMADDKSHSKIQLESLGWLGKGIVYILKLLFKI